MNKKSIYQTNRRHQIENLDTLPLIDRSLIDYDKYHKFVGHAGVKYSMAIQATRGCPWECFYCDIYKTSPIHRRKSVEHIFKEVKYLTDIGVKRIEFIDDIFNANRKNFISFFKLVLKHQLDVKFFFPSGLKGDLLDEEMIDLMVEVGVIGINLSLEHASPRLQKVMRKNLNVEKLHDNLQYITEKHPSVVIGLNAMFGFPTETEEEALMNLDYIKSIRWIHFPYLHNVIIFPGTELERFALESGIPRVLIEQSQDKLFNELPATLPFSQDFTKSVRTMFLRDYVLSKERLLHILPYQLEQFCEDELNQKYNSYFPTRIKSLNNLLDLVRIDRSELRPVKNFEESRCRIPNLKTRIKAKFPTVGKKKGNAMRLMLIDLSAYFSQDIESSEYDVLESPIGLMSLLSYVNREFGDRIEGKIYKSRIDFHRFADLYDLTNEFSPDIIGVRTLTLYKDFFHEAIAYIRKRGIKVPIIAGGPYATASSVEILQDKNINLVVIGEGELTFANIIERTLYNDKHIPNAEVLKQIDGIAFVK